MPIDQIVAAARPSQDPLRLQNQFEFFATLIQMADAHGKAACNEANCARQSSKEGIPPVDAIRGTALRGKPTRPY